MVREPRFPIRPRCTGISSRPRVPPEGHGQQNHLHNQEGQADAVQHAESSRSGLSGGAQSLDRGRDQQGGAQRAEPREQRRNGGPAAPENERTDRGQRRERGGLGIQARQHAGPSAFTALAAVCAIVLGRRRAAIAPLLAGLCALGSSLLVTPAIQALRAAGETASGRFGMLHGVSLALLVVEMILLAVALWRNAES